MHINTRFNLLALRIALRPVCIASGEIYTPRSGDKNPCCRRNPFTHYPDTTNYRTGAVIAIITDGPLSLLPRKNKLLGVEASARLIRVPVLLRNNRFGSFVPMASAINFRSPLRFLLRRPSSFQ